MRQQHIESARTEFLDTDDSHEIQSVESLAASEHGEDTVFGKARRGFNMATSRFTSGGGDSDSDSAKQTKAQTLTKPDLYPNRKVLGTKDQEYVLETKTAAQRKFIALLTMSIILLLAAGAVFAALYAPQHMPETISAIVAGLSPIALQGVFMGAAAGATAGVIGLAASAVVKNPSIGLDKLSMFGLVSKDTGTELTAEQQAEAGVKFGIVSTSA